MTLEYLSDVVEAFQKQDFNGFILSMIAGLNLVELVVIIVKHLIK